MTGGLRSSIFPRVNTRRVFSVWLLFQLILVLTPEGCNPQCVGDYCDANDDLRELRQRLMDESRQLERYFRMMNETLKNLSPQFEEQAVGILSQLEAIDASVDSLVLKSSPQTNPSRSSIPGRHLEGLQNELVADTLVSEDHLFIDISTSTEVTCGILIDGSAVCWGRNEHGECEVPTISESWAKIDVGWMHVCGVTISGTLHCWGDSREGLTTPPILPEGEVWQDIHGGERGTCGVTSRRRGVCWPKISVHPDAREFKWRLLDTDLDYVCGITVAGEGYCWSGNNDGDGLGLHKLPGEGPWRHLTVDINDDLWCALNEADDIFCWRSSLDFISIPTSSSSSGWSWLSGPCAITKLNELKCWGFKEDIPLVQEGWSRVAAASISTRNRRCAITRAGLAHCWGFDYLKRMERFPLNTAWKHISVEEFQGCGVTLSGKINCWHADSVLYPAPEGNDFVSVTAGDSHSCGLTSSNTLVCSGLCAFGQCSVPNSPTGWKLVAAGPSSTCGVSVDGVLCCWGDNDIAITKPCNFEPDAERRDWEHIAFQHTILCGAIRGGDIMCWRDNNKLPFDLQSNIGWKSVSVGGGKVCGVTNDGELKCSFEVPLTLLSDTDGNQMLWNSVSLSYDAVYTCGILVNGTILCAQSTFVNDEQVHGTIMSLRPEQRWRIIAVHDQGWFCGVENSTNIGFCWGKYVELEPLPYAASRDFSMRFAHLSGLRLGTSMLCGYQYLIGRHRCIGLNGMYDRPQPGKGEVMYVLGTAAMAFFPQQGEDIPSGSPVTFYHDQYKTIQQTLPVEVVVTKVVPGNRKLYCLMDKAAVVYFSMDVGELNFEKFLDSTTFVGITGPIEAAAASDLGVCVLNSNHQLWCNGPMEHLGEGFKAVDVSDTHACGVTLAGAIECWGEGEPAVPSSSSSAFTSVATSAALTCGITNQFALECWGARASDGFILATAARSGWVEVSISEELFCASHVNGALHCHVISPSLVLQPRISPDLSLVETVVGLAPSLGSEVLCLSSESCLTSDPAKLQSIVYSSVLFLEDIELDRAFDSNVGFLGARVTVTGSPLQVTITCGKRVEGSCITLQPRDTDVRVANVKVTGNEGLALEVSGGNSFSLSRTSWSLPCVSYSPSTLVVVSGVDQILIEHSDWSGEEGCVSYLPAFTPRRNATGDALTQASLSIYDPINVTIVNSRWKGLPMSGLTIESRSRCMTNLGLLDSNFEANFGAEVGAGLSVNDFCAGTGQEQYLIRNTLFHDNIAERAGGGLYWNRRHANQLSDESCFGCSRGSLGSLIAYDVAFRQNHAFHGEGGGGWLNGLSTAFFNSEIRNNVAGFQGGGLWLSHGSLEVSNSVFEGNEVGTNLTAAISQGAQHTGGGAIHLDTCEHKGFQGNYTRFHHNRVENVGSEGLGGAIVTMSCRFTMWHSDVLHNKVDGAGGGAFIDGAPSPSLIESSTFGGNVASSKGGGMVANNSALHFSAVNIVENSVELPTDHEEQVTPYETSGIGGGISIRGGSVLSMDQTLFENNAATQGGGVHIQCDNSITMSGPDFRGNNATHSGTEYFSECKSPWLETMKVLVGTRSLSMPSAPAVGSGPVRLVIESSVEALFEGSKSPEAIAILALVNINDRREVADSTTKCSVNASVIEPQGITPGLIGRSEYEADQGFVNITDFGFTAPAAQTLSAIVDCRKLGVSITLSYPVARLRPTWSRPPPHTWSPSSGSAFVPIEPDPLILLQTPYPLLLQGAVVVCTAGTRFANVEGTSGSRSISLLNPPASGYTNSLNNGTIVPLPALQVSASYGSTVILTVECVRDSEILPKLNWTLHLTTPTVHWVRRPPDIVTSGQIIRMSVGLDPADLPGAPATSCSVVALRSSQDPNLVIQSATAFWGVNEIAWSALTITGLLGTSNTVVVNCSTGLHGIPQGKVLNFLLSTCSAGYQPDDTATRCLPCTGTTHSTGHFEPCRGCPLQGAVCENGTLQLLEGYFPAERRHLSSRDISGIDGATILYKCDTRAACLLSNRTLPYRCATGYKGALCAACDSELEYARSGTECVACWPSWLTGLFLSSLACLLMAALVYIAIFRRPSKPKSWKIVMRMILTYLQMLSSVLQFRAKATEAVQQVLGVTDTVGQSVFSFPPLQCVFNPAYYTRFTISVSLPLIVGVLVILLACAGMVIRGCMYRRSKPGSKLVYSVSLAFRRYFQQKAFLEPTLFIFFLFYNSVSTSVAAMFRCREEMIDGVQYLHADILTPCYDSQHYAGQAFAGFIGLTFNVAVPMALLRVLKRNASRLNSSEIQARYGFLYYGYSIRRKLYGWEIVVLMRKFSILLISSGILEPYFQSLAGLTVLVFFFLLQVHFRPYDRPLFNTLEATVLGCLTGTHLASLCYFRYASSYSKSREAIEGIVTFSLLAMNVGCLSLLVYFMAREWRRERMVSRSGTKPPAGGSQSVSTPIDTIVNRPWTWSRHQLRPIPLPKAQPPPK